MTTASFALLSRRLRKFGRLPRADRGLLLEAAVWLALARLAVKTTPFKHIAPSLGRHMAESAATTDAVTEVRARRVGWAVRTVAHYTPWDSNCLAQAMAAKRLLRRRRIASTLYLGLAKNDDDTLDAHAWLRCGASVLTGGRGSPQRFRVVGMFAEDEP